MGFEAINLVTGYRYGPFDTVGAARAFVVAKGFKIFAVRADNGAEHYGAASGTSPRDFARAVSAKRLNMWPVPPDAVVG